MSTGEQRKETAVISPHFVRAVHRGAEALRQQAEELERSKDFNSEESVGRILRVAAEEDRLTSAMLLDWVERHREQVGIEKVSLGSMW